jgi:Pregnancy-associated plasma protein-A
MRTQQHLRAFSMAMLGATALTFTTLAAPAHAVRVDEGASLKTPCLESEVHDAPDAARGGRSGDHRDISAKEQRAIAARTATLLKQRGVTAGAAAAVSATVPVYVHVMLSSSGAGDVTQAQIDAQIAELNQDFAGGESSVAADTGFSFSLAGVDRFYNNSWHQDRQSTTYRKKTRQGGANALNIWLVDFNYLGIATFPWDYARNPGIDGIRVQYTSLPGGSATNYDLGKTATHEAGHWFGLYHTFQGGCTSTNDEVSDTPAQGSSTSGCPAGRDSCNLPGLDPIHNYMDYSYDSCYDQFTPGQSTRASSMWAAYRA